MKQIIKGTEPEAYANWKAEVNDNWQPTYEALAGAPKQALKNALTSDQGHICCYCERRLIDTDSHIEHFRPQSDSTIDALDFANLLCSCNPLEQGRRKPRHCGNLKDDWFDLELLISPFDSDCETRFSYRADGRIMPANPTDCAAAETISRLGLDIQRLRALRSKVVDVFVDVIDEPQFEAALAAHLEKDKDGRFGEFWTTVRHLFR